MSKYKLLIESLYENGSFNKREYSKLIKADNRVIKHLTRELLANPNADIRETCAEILRDRGHARAVPALIEALKDRQLFVRQDALWAIGPLCGLKPASLENAFTNHKHRSTCETLPESQQMVERKQTLHRKQLWDMVAAAEQVTAADAEFTRCLSFPKEAKSEK